MSAIFLYLILCSGSDGCTVNKRYAMPDWKTCALAASTVKVSFPEKTTENEGGAGAFCAGPDQWRDQNSDWHMPALKK